MNYKTCISRIVKSLICLILFFSTNSCLAQKIQKTYVNKKVLLIGFDGIRIDAFDVLLKKGQLPNMSTLVSNGKYLKATTSDLTGSWGGWSDVLRGVHRNRHEAGYWGESGKQNVAPPANHPDFLGTPDLFTRLESNDNKINTAAFNTWSGLDKILDKPDYRAFVNYEKLGDSLMTLQAKEYLESNNPDVTYFYQGDTDIAGHNNGFGPNLIASKLNAFSKKYKESIIKADENVGEVIKVIKERAGVKNGKESWLILFTSDHGATEGGHSQNRIAERYVPFIISGINLEIFEPFPLKKDVLMNPKNVDILPTILTYLEIPKSSNAWSGLIGHNLYFSTNGNEFAKKLELDTNLIFNSGAEYDVGFNGHEETINIGGSKDSERDWPTEGLYWDQSVSGWDDWSLTPSRNSMTIIFYEAGEKIMYPKQSYKTGWDRGRNFFAGGIDGKSIITQVLDVSEFLNEFNRKLSFELSAYLGGFENVEDTVNFKAIFMNDSGDEILTKSIKGPGSLERNDKTVLIQKRMSGNIPVGTSKIKFVLETYGRHGYADNLSFKVK